MYVIVFIQKSEHNFKSARPFEASMGVYTFMWVFWQLSGDLNVYFDSEILHLGTCWIWKQLETIPATAVSVNPAAVWESVCISVHKHRHTSQKHNWEKEVKLNCTECGAYRLKSRARKMAVLTRKPAASASVRSANGKAAMSKSNGACASTSLFFLPK